MATPQTVLDLNLATRPFRNNTVLWTGFVLGLAAVLALSWWNVARYRTTVHELDSLRSEIGSYGSRLQDFKRRNEAAKRGIDKQDLELLSVQTTKANDVILLKAFSWTKLFNRLEEVLPYNVRMERIDPLFRIGDHDRGPIASEDLTVPIVVSGRSKDLVAFLDFEAALLESPYFDRVEPERHQPNNQEVDFSLRFSYYPNRKVDAPGSIGGDEATGEGGPSGEEVPEAPPAEAEVADGEAEPADAGEQG
jgi:hypothetical protein